jgi:hypothetical protein
MTNLLCLLVGIAIPLLAVLLAARRALRPVAAAAAYRNVAWRLGLEADTRGTSIRGQLEGRRLFVGTVETPALGRRAHRGVLEFDLPLGLGLSLKPRGMASRLRNRTQRQRPPGPLGEPELDEALDVRTTDPAATRALFSDPVRNALSDLWRRWPDLEIDDRGLSVLLRNPPQSEARLRELIDALRGLAGAMEEARLAVDGDPTLVMQTESWQAIAATRGLTFLPQLPALVGEHRGRRVQVVAAKGLAGWTAEVRVRPLPHPATGLRLRPHLDAGPLGAGRQDIVVGDALFDDAFIVIGYDPTSVRSLLGPDARVALTAAHQLGRVLVNDAVLELTELPLDAPTLDSALSALSDAAESFGW